MGNEQPSRAQPPSRVATTSIAALSAIKIALGASSIIAPQLAYSLFLLELKPNAVVVARLFGSSCAALGAATWALNRRVSRATAHPDGASRGPARELEAERRADLKKVVAFNLAADTVDVMQWGQLVSEAFRVGIPEATLMERLDSHGVGLLSLLEPDLFDLLQRFPAVHDALLVASEYDLSFHCCNAYSAHPRTFKRTEETRAHRDEMVQLCAGLNAMISPRVYMCLHEDFAPPCIRFPAEFNECVTFRKQWIKHVSSIEPNEAAGHCELYETEDCTGPYLEITDRIPMLYLAGLDKFPTQDWTTYTGWNDPDTAPFDKRRTVYDGTGNTAPFDKWRSVSQALGTLAGTQGRVLDWANVYISLPPEPEREKPFAFSHGQYSHDIVYFATFSAGTPGTPQWMPAITPIRIRNNDGIQDLDENQLPDLIPATSSFDDLYGITQRYNSAWIYRISTGPHMIRQPDMTEGQKRDYLAIGGILWSQISAFAVVMEGQNRTDLVWRENPEYDRFWEQYGASPWQPLFDATDPGRAAALSRFHDAVGPDQDDTDPYGFFLDELLRNDNPTMTRTSRNRLRRLLDWNRGDEPSRTFPLGRTIRDVSLQVHALLAVDWTGLGLPADTVRMLQGGFPLEDQVGQAVIALAGSRYHTQTFATAMGVGPAESLDGQIASQVGASAKRKRCEDEIEEKVDELRRQGKGLIEEARNSAEKEIVTELLDLSRQNLCASSSEATVESCVKRVSDGIKKAGSNKIEPEVLSLMLQEIGRREAGLRCTQTLTLGTFHDDHREAAEAWRSPVPAGARLMFDAQTIASEWDEFSTEARRRSISYDELLRHLDRGMTGLERLNPILLDMMWLRFPAVFNTLRIAAAHGLTFSTCTRLAQYPPDGVGGRGKRADEGEPHRHPMDCAATLSPLLIPKALVCLGIDFESPCKRLRTPLHVCSDMAAVRLISRMGSRRLNLVALVAVMVMASMAVAETAADVGAAVFLAEEGQGQPMSRQPGFRAVELAASDHFLFLGMSFDCNPSGASSAKCAPVTRGGEPDLVPFSARDFGFAFHGEEKHEARPMPAATTAGLERLVAYTTATATSPSHRRGRMAALVFDMAGRRRQAQGATISSQVDTLVLDGDTRLERPATTPRAQAAGPSSKRFAAGDGAKRTTRLIADDADNDDDDDRTGFNSLVPFASTVNWPNGGATWSPHGSTIALLLGTVFGLAAAPSVGVVL
ncbi:Benzoate carboxyl methyltransferase [Purpureocillium lavendulum]|uniref:Benzoate carboxyl methyltransferase n=1 Tax=Purpureocillium lavendulum TaxID=1247861 RepID=A0AB34FH85_9HYPO|nr:Benzoate carboxyl methyltransferase [Purpureocillium lavendulum]